jgi:hypothetical protein
MSPSEAVGVAATTFGAICLVVLALGLPVLWIPAIIGVLAVVAVVIRLPSTPGSGNDFCGWFGDGGGFGGGDGGGGG